MSGEISRKGMEWWDRFCKLPRFSFIKTGEFDAVTAWENAGGAWIGQYEASMIVDEMQSELNAAKVEIDALNNRLKIKSVPDQQ